MTPWRVVVGFGVVSLAADMVYEGARSIYGPLLGLLGLLGASALVVGLVTGAGEAMTLLLRLVSGTLADRTGRYLAIGLLLGIRSASAVTSAPRATAPRRRPGRSAVRAVRTALIVVFAALQVAVLALLVATLAGRSRTLSERPANL